MIGSVEEQIRRHELSRLNDEWSPGRVVDPWVALRAMLEPGDFDVEMVESMRDEPELTGRIERLQSAIRAYRDATGRRYQGQPEAALYAALDE